jgi:hypothetical protein
LPVPRKDGRHYEELWRAIKYRAATTGETLEIACAAEQRLLISRGVSKRKTKDIPYRIQHPRCILKCEHTEIGVLFTLFHPMPI